MNQQIEVIRENLTPTQVLAIRQQERAAGRMVNINRLHDNLVEIQIIHPARVIDITASRGGRILAAG